MPLLGAHMSTAGGLYKAADSAVAHGMRAVQIFTHSPSQWSVKAIENGKKSSKKSAAASVWEAKTLKDDDVARFREKVIEHKLATLIHVSYLINLATSDEFLWRRSIAALAGELLRAEQLSIPYVVMHPGAFVGGSEEQGLAQVARGLDEVETLVKASAGEINAHCLLENTAGQGTCLGWSFAQLAAIIGQVKSPERLGVCFDTCHAFAAGYGLQTPAEYKRTFTEFDATVGLAKLKAFHLNDSKRERGSRVDRHEHIGEGKLGLEPFRLLLADKRFSQAVMCLETPKGDRDGQTLDAVNMATLESLLPQAKRKTKAAASIC